MVKRREYFREVRERLKVEKGFVFFILSFLERLFLKYFLVIKLVSRYSNLVILDGEVEEGFEVNFLELFWVLK